MPTENRSSNTEMVSVPRDLIELALAHLPSDSAAKWEIYDVLVQPAPPSHPEPIAWMVDTAFWWTKEEAERDAAETGLAIVGLGPMIDTAEVARLRGENEQLREVIKHSDSNIQRQSLRISNQRAQLLERDALLDRLRNHLIAKGVLGDFGPELFQILNIEAPDRAVIAES
ncbi:MULTISPECIES: hypothetical protein [Pseudomonas putida group]|uniref:hypothetical protein n=1 Tax=Pseudomonas putida group TaxID=136845 RepID=UPI00067B5C58|nr:MULTISPECIES: hypothetical protein [Pseudomonas putida group]